MKLKMMKTILTSALLTAACFALTGCVSTDRSDLENYVADILARPGGRIPSLPPIKPYEAYLYQSGKLELRNPFRSFFQKNVGTAEIKPESDPEQIRFTTEILTHNREELEQFELDSLRMVGILENNDAFWAIIQDVEGAVHRVQTGHYIGSNFGKILNIQEDRIDLREIVKDSTGRWEERQATLALSEQ
jgi:type IV pilus assembly protein PilP